MITYNLEEDALYQEGLKKGIEKTISKCLTREYLNRQKSPTLPKFQWNMSKKFNGVYKKNKLRLEPNLFYK